MRTHRRVLALHRRACGCAAANAGARGNPRREEAVPCSNRRARSEDRARRDPRADKDAWGGDDNVMRRARQVRVLAADGKRRRARDQPGLVRAEDELAGDHKRLQGRISHRKERERTRTADSSGVPLWYEMSGAVDEHVGPVSLLMHDPREFAVVCRPFGRRLAGEALNAAERRVLDHH
jgi:hypothetical protein